METRDTSVKITPEIHATQKGLRVSEALLKC